MANELKFYHSLGGGLGDVVWDFMREGTCHAIRGLVEERGARIRIVTQCHNDGVADLFRNHPYVHEHVMEAWHPPRPEDPLRFNSPDADGYLPLTRGDLVQNALGGSVVTPFPPELYLSEGEKADLGRLRRLGDPLLVVQPFAGMSDRDAFDPEALRRFVEAIVRRAPRAVIAVVGKNHERGCHYSIERVGFTHPNVVDLIDQTGIRFNFHLVGISDGFVGSHSNLIRTAWEFRKRNICVLPAPLMTDHIPCLDRKYVTGWSYPESRIFTFPFGEGVPKQFEALDCEGIADFLLRG